MSERIWEKFLTDEDRRMLARRAPRRPREHGTTPCLLLVDLYRWVFGDDPASSENSTRHWPASCGAAAWTALPYIERVLNAARSAGLPIIHTTEDPTGQIRAWSRSTGQGDTPDDQWSTRFEIMESVRPLPGEVVLVKDAPGAFSGTPLAFHLNAIGVDTVIVVGESTSGCIRATVVEGVTHRFDIIVVEECVFDRVEFAHAANLFDMHQKYADVMPIDDAQAYIEQCAVGPTPE